MEFLRYIREQMSIVETELPRKRRDNVHQIMQKLSALATVSWDVK